MRGHGFIPYNSVPEEVNQGKNTTKTGFFQHLGQAKVFKLAVTLFWLSHGP
jgi:hypothetical protein